MSSSFCSLYKCFLLVDRLYHYICNRFRIQLENIILYLRPFILSFNIFSKKFNINVYFWLNDMTIEEILQIFILFSTIYNFTNLLFLIVISYLTFKTLQFHKI